LNAAPLCVWRCCLCRRRRRLQHRPPRRTLQQRPHHRRSGLQVFQRFEEWHRQHLRAGFARHQSELRELAVMPTPVGLRDRSVFCLCLATGYATPVDLAGTAAGRGGS
jgi:hypothetical protein